MQYKGNGRRQRQYGSTSSYLVPFFQSDPWCMAFHMKTNFHSHAYKTYFHIKGMCTRPPFQKEAQDNSEVA